MSTTSGTIPLSTLRAAPFDLLLGDYTKAKTKLGWTPTVNLEDLAKMMVDHDMELASREKTLRDAGHKFPARTGQHEHPQLRV